MYVGMGDGGGIVIGGRERARGHGRGRGGCYCVMSITFATFATHVT